MASDTKFDPYTQSFTLLTADGTPFNLSMPALDYFILYTVQICINYAAQLGASMVLLILLALLTKPEKRRSPIFILNVLSLAFNVIRNLLQCLYFTGPFNETYAYFAEDYQEVPPSAYAISVTATVFTTLLLMAIEASLLFQTQVVCLTLRQKYRHIILGTSITVALIAIGFRITLCILNSEATVSVEYLEPFQWVRAAQWVASATNITTTVSICWFCAVFVAKLGVALYQRRKLGLRRFGPMQILFIMGCQSLVIPVLFSILEYTTPLPSMDSNVLTLVAILLPLSSMWASSSTEKAGKPRAIGFVKKNHILRTTSFYAEKEITSPFTSSDGSTTANDSIVSPDLKNDVFAVRYTYPEAQ